MQRVQKIRSTRCGKRQKDQKSRIKSGNKRNEDLKYHTAWKNLIEEHLMEDSLKRKVIRTQ